MSVSIVIARVIFFFFFQIEMVPKYAAGKEHTLVVIM
jgi:hypothetical protein